MKNCLVTALFDTMNVTPVFRVTLMFMRAWMGLTVCHALVLVGHLFFLGWVDLGLLGGSFLLAAIGGGEIRSLVHEHVVLFQQVSKAATFLLPSLPGKLEVLLGGFRGHFRVETSEHHASGIDGTYFVLIKLQRQFLLLFLLFRRTPILVVAQDNLGQIASARQGQRQLFQGQTDTLRCIGETAHGNTRNVRVTRGWLRANCRSLLLAHDSVYVSSGGTRASHVGDLKARIGKEHASALAHIKPILLLVGVGERCRLSIVKSCGLD
mmetsp:Transcript_13009/g.26397  ORF Transcript_13009/g.26397 Transcript_13009/m.26397 type:complete len:266 (-) Transcript_13009:1004-1801(-)